MLCIGQFIGVGVLRPPVLPARTLTSAELICWGDGTLIRVLPPFASGLYCQCQGSVGASVCLTVLTVVWTLLCPESGPIKTPQKPDPMQKPRVFLLFQHSVAGLPTQRQDGSDSEREAWLQKGRGFR